MRLLFALHLQLLLGSRSWCCPWILGLLPSLRHSPSLATWRQWLPGAGAAVSCMCVGSPGPGAPSFHGSLCLHHRDKATAATRISSQQLLSEEPP